MNTHPSTYSTTSNPWFVATLCLLTFGLGFGVATSMGTGSKAATSGNAPAPQAAADPANLKPAAAADGWMVGKKDAPVTVIEFSDYQCPFCRRFVKQTLPDLQKNYIDTGKVKMVHRSFPLSMHPMAKPFAMAVACAQDQGDDKALGMYNTIFEQQDAGGTVSLDVLPDWAKKVSGLDFNTWKSCYDGNKKADKIAADQKDGAASGVSGTPSFWILGPNGQSKQIKGAQPIAAFSAAIDAMIK